MASTTTYFHVHPEDRINVCALDGGRVHVDIGAYPGTTTLFMSEATALEFARAILAELTPSTELARVPSEYSVAQQLAALAEPTAAEFEWHGPRNG